MKALQSFSNMPRRPRSRTSEPRTHGPRAVNLAATRRRALTAFERLYVVRQLRRHGGNIELAAERSGISPRALRALIKRHGVDSQEYLPPSHPSLVIPRRPRGDG